MRAPRVILCGSHKPCCALHPAKTLRIMEIQGSTDGFAVQHIGMRRVARGIPQRCRCTTLQLWARHTLSHAVGPTSTLLHGKPAVAARMMDIWLRSPACQQIASRKRAVSAAGSAQRSKKHLQQVTCSSAGGRQPQLHMLQGLQSSRQSRSADEVVVGSCAQRAVVSVTAGLDCDCCGRRTAAWRCPQAAQQIAHQARRREGQGGLHPRVRRLNEPLLS